MIRCRAWRAGGADVRGRRSISEMSNELCIKDDETETYLRRDGERDLVRRGDLVLRYQVSRVFI